MAVEDESGPPWLAAYTRPRFEFKVKEYCEVRGIEVLLPTYQSRRRWSDRNKLLQLPIFPSYIFVRPDTGERMRPIHTPGFLWYVHNRFGPVCVAEEEILTLRRLLDSGLEYDPLPSVELGDEVEILSGALRGCRGYLTRKERNCIVLTVRAINGAVRVALQDDAQLRRTRQSHLHQIPSRSLTTADGGPKYC